MKTQYLILKEQEVSFVIIKIPQSIIKLRFKKDVLVIENSTGFLDETTQRFVQEKARWILTHLNRKKNYLDKIDKVKSLPEGKVWLLGKVYSYEFVKSKKNFFRFEEQLLRVFTNEENPSLKTVYRVLRAFAQKFLVQRTELLSKETGLTPASIRIKVQRSKWGSCSSQKNINLNWRLIFLEPASIDYVIIHELCHLKHLNHSNKFWELVETYCPHYKSCEKYLKENQWVLDIYPES